MRMLLLFLMAFVLALAYSPGELSPGETGNQVSCAEAELAPVLGIDVAPVVASLPAIGTGQYAFIIAVSDSPTLPQSTRSFSNRGQVSLPLLIRHA